MSNRYLGPTFDIHGGGRDLLFPHHENERAQSVCANRGEFARYWVHNGFVTVESEKMSKSLGNFLTIRDALKAYHPEVLRLFLLSKHYRGPLDFSKNDVQALQGGLVRIYRTFQRIDELSGSSPAVPETGSGSPFLERFVEMMDEDLNTGGAIGLVFDKVREMNRVMDASEGGLDPETRLALERDRHEILEAGRTLGLFQESPADFFAQLADASPPMDAQEIERLIEQRAAARSQKEWAAADAIRDRLKAMGIVLEDGPGGTTWRLDV